MAVEQLLSQLLGEAPGTFGRNSIQGQTTEALSNSGLVQAIRDSFSTQETALASLAAALGAPLRALGEELRTSNRYLASLESSVANPLETAARELQRRGLYALERGWYPEAREALTAAIEKSPLSFELHMALGLALQGDGDAVGAEAAFQRTQRYAARDSPAAAVGAALLLATLAHEKGDRSREVALLREATEDFPTNAEAFFRLSVIEHDVKLLNRALVLAPELAPVARRVFPVDPDPLLSKLAGTQEAPIAVAFRARQLLLSFSETFEPPVQLRWVYALGSESEDETFLAAAETFNYLRSRAEDLYRLSRYAIINNQLSRLTERSDTLLSLVSLRTSIRRQTAWIDIFTPADKAPTGVRPPIRVVVRTNGLVVPGAPDDSQLSDPDLIELSGSVVEYLERGDILSAERLVREAHPRLGREAALHMLGEVTRKRLTH